MKGRWVQGGGNAARVRSCHLIVVAMQHRGRPDGIAALAATATAAAAAAAAASAAAAAAASGVVGVGEGDRVSRQLS